MHKSLAWPLALVYTALIVFASLFPFEGWRVQGVEPLAFLLAPLPPPYWSGFDVAINIAGYAPLGFLLCLALLRPARAPAGPLGAPGAVLLAALAAGLLALTLEFLQIYLPRRVPSTLDLVLNLGGALLGALGSALLVRLGVLRRWSDLRQRWFVPEASGALLLLALWPLALLAPAAIPFGLGQVLARLQALLAALEQALGFAPAQLPGAVARGAWADWIDWSGRADPPSPGSELLCVALGLLCPCLLGYCVIAAPGRRALFALALMALGVALTALAAALGWGPVHAWDWLTRATRAGLLCALVLALALLALPRRACAALLLAALAWQLLLLNQAGGSAYFAQNLQTWEQGRFIRFYGLAQWLGWLWPYAVLAYALRLLLRRSARAGRL